MTTPTYSDPQPGVVQHLRSIRDQMSHEIKDMTFEQERAHLDRLLAGKPTANAQQCPTENGPAE